MKSKIHYIIVGILSVTNLFAQENITIEFNMTTENYNQERTLEIIINENGKEHSKFSKILKPHLSIPEVEVLNNKNFVLIHSLEGIVEFYDLTGNLLKKITLYSTPPYNEQRLLFSISKNSISLLVSENNINRIIISDFLGNNISTFNIEDGLPIGIAFSHEEDYMAYSLVNWKGEILNKSSYIMDLKNNKTIKKAVQFEKGQFSSSTNLFLGYTNNSSFLLDIIIDKIVWEKKTSSNEIYIDGILVNENVFIIAAGNPKFENKEWVYPYSKVVSINLTGEEIRIKNINNSQRKISLDKINEKLYLNFDGSKEEIIINSLDK